MSSLKISFNGLHQMDETKQRGFFFFEISEADMSI